MPGSPRPFPFHILYLDCLVFLSLVWGRRGGRQPPSPQFWRDSDRPPNPPAVPQFWGGNCRILGGLRSAAMPRFWGPFRRMYFLVRAPGSRGGGLFGPAIQDFGLSCFSLSLFALS